MFLTTEELEELTDLTRPSAQIRWLAENGYQFDVGASGRPKVLSSAVASRLGGSKEKRKAVPHWDRI